MKVLKRNGIKAIKVTEHDYTCRCHKFEVGKTYRLEGEALLCKYGFHACTKAQDCFNYYSFDPQNRVLEVLIWGDVDGVNKERHDPRTVDSKICGTRMTVLREISWEELLALANSGNGNSGNNNSGDGNSGNNNSGDGNSGNNNSGDGNSGKDNSGDYNSGDGNSGDCNSGDHNSGDRNSGDHNSGDRNSGDHNSGDRNSGDYNSGDYNSGDYNSGNDNSGNDNSGDRNSGDYNSGDYNSGERNSGNHNSGDWNSCDRSNGYFCSQTPPLMFFNKPTDKSLNEIDFPVINYSLTKWIPLEHMSEKEQEDFPDSKTCRGYLKTFSYKEMWINGWAKDTDKNKIKVFNLPNFDLKIFEEITGIDATEDYRNLMGGRYIGIKDDTTRED